MSNVFYVAAATLLVNIPFGYWRESARKFSWQWFIAVHAAVPLVIAMRMRAGIDWQVPVVALFILCYFAGQFIGARLKRRRNPAAGTDAA